MKKILVLFICINSFLFLGAQGTGGKDISELSGKKILGLFPSQVKGQSANKDKDKVFGPKKHIGVTVHRDYTSGKKKMTLTLVNRSPSVTTVNELITKTSASNSGKYTVADIKGYPALIQKVVSENNSPYLELLLPINNSLLILKGNDVTENDLITEARKINLEKIAENL